MKQSLVALAALAALTKAATHDPSTRGPICGSRGFDTNHEGYYYGAEATYDGCSAQCLKDAECKSFSFGNGQCNLYKVPVLGNFAGVFGSPFIFYDASCISTPSTTTSGQNSSTLAASMSSSSSSTTTAGQVSTTLISTTRSKASKSTTAQQNIVTSTSNASSPSSSVSSPASSSGASSSGAPPCPFPTFTVTNFKYFNSTHNADCADGILDGDGTGCLDVNGQWCDPRIDAACAANNHCGVPICMTGLPTQPVGYGPADTVSADITNIGSCATSNPGGWPLRPVSGGNAVCYSGNMAEWTFDGDSTKAASVAYFTLQTLVTCPDGSSYEAVGKGQTAMSCSYDSGNNATCILNTPSFDVPATQFSNVQYS